MRFKNLVNQKSFSRINEDYEYSEAVRIADLIGKKCAMSRAFDVLDVKIIRGKIYDVEAYIDVSWNITDSQDAQVREMIKIIKPICSKYGVKFEFFDDEYSAQIYTVDGILSVTFGEYFGKLNPRDIIKSY